MVEMEARATRGAETAIPPALWLAIDFLFVIWAYSVNLADMFRRAATIVDKILKGAKPADLAVE